MSYTHRNPMEEGAPNLASLSPLPARRQSYPTMYVFRVVPIYFPIACDHCIACDEWMMYGSGFEFELCGHSILGEIMVFFKFDSEGKSQKIP